MDKAPDAFRTISEVADDLDVPQHVLRFWETRFVQIKPMKRSGGRRYYRPDDVELLRGIRHLLYGQGYTIRGVQRILREQGIKAVQGRQETRPEAGLRPAPLSRVVEMPPDDARDDEVEAEADVDIETHDDIRPETPSVQTDSAEEMEPLRHGAPVQHRAESVPERAPPAISVENRERLASVLGDLVECRRLLDVALGGT